MASTGDHQILGFGFDLNEMLGIGVAFANLLRMAQLQTIIRMAWEGACTATEEVYDANLRVDGDDDPVPPAQQ